MIFKIYQIDAFAERTFEGNPATVVPLASWLPDETMQHIAAENNLSETAFFVPTGNGYHIRWFTPNKEVDLCGHATLAAAYVLLSCLNYRQDIIEFESRSGKLAVTRTGDCLTLDFPLQQLKPCESPQALIEGLGKRPDECYAGEDYLAIFSSQDEVATVRPNMDKLEQLALRGVIISAPSRDMDFVARFFAPKYGIPEDPVTGSAYTLLAPYWSERLGKAELSARQISARGGNVSCRMQNDRVLISGKAVKFLEGEIEIKA